MSDDPGILVLGADSSLAINCWLEDLEAGTWSYKFAGAAMRMMMDRDPNGTPLARIELYDVGEAGEPLPTPSGAIALAGFGDTPVVSNLWVDFAGAILFTQDFVVGNPSAPNLANWAFGEDSETAPDLLLEMYDPPGTFVDTVLVVGSSDQSVNFRASGGFNLTLGEAYKTGGGTWAVLASMAALADARPFQPGLDAILQLQPIEWQEAASPARPGRRGRLPQPRAGDAAKIACFGFQPESLGGFAGAVRRRDSETLVMTADQIAPALVNAVRELAERVAALENSAPAARREP